MLKLALMLISGTEEASVPVSRADETRRQILEQFSEGWYGFRPLLGGMPMGAGFAAGTAFEKGAFKGTARASVKGYQKYEGAFSLRNLVTGVWFVLILQICREYRRMVPHV